MDHLPDALEAATGRHPDDLDLPALHHRARSRRTGRRAVLLTGALGLVAATGLGVAATTGGGGSRAQLTASEGTPEATSTAPAGGPCDSSSTTTTAMATTTTALAAFEPSTTIDPLDPSVTDASTAPFETSTTTTTCVPEAPANTSTSSIPGIGTSSTTIPDTASTGVGSSSPHQITLTATFSGEGPVLSRSPQGCAQMHHELLAGVTFDDGSAGVLSESYCGVNDGRTWTGGGTFTIDSANGHDLLSGSFTSRAALPTTGEPYRLNVERGTGRFGGATGTCDVDNHMEDTAPGRNRQFGTLSCTLQLGEAPAT